MTIAFNGHTHTVPYGPYSTSASIASAFAAEFSSYPASAWPKLCTLGVCAKATGATIVFQLKGASFGAFTYSSTGTSPFSLSAPFFTPVLAFAPIGPVTFGVSPFAVTASSSSPGAVTYSVSSGTALASISGSTVTIKGIGSVTLMASQAAAPNYASATAFITFTVNPETPTLTFTAIGPQIYPEPAFTVSASSASSGAIVYTVSSGQTFASVSGSTVTITGVGSVTLMASQAASGNYGTATALASFTVTAAALAITSFSPQTGPPGTHITIIGTGFGSTIGTSTVRFNATLSTPTSWSGTQIIVPVPAGTSTGSITVTVNGASVSSASKFTPTPPPTVTSLSFTEGPPQMGLIVLGVGFGSTQGTGTVTFGGVAASVVAGTWSDSSITVQVPGSASITSSYSAPVVVTAGTASNSFAFTIDPPFACNVTP
jgi:hypothetical protein